MLFSEGKFHAHSVRRTQDIAVYNHTASIRLNLDIIIAAENLRTAISLRTGRKVQIRPPLAFDEFFQLIVDRLGIQPVVYRVLP